MSQEFPQQYYMVVDEKSTGPFTLDEITLHPKLTPETLVWKPGIENWVPAYTLPELSPAFRQKESQYRHTPPEYNQPNGEDFNKSKWREPYDYSQRPENHDFNRFAGNPQYQQNHSYQNDRGYYQRQYRYNNGYRPNFHTNWLPWAIVATILGFFTSCIGAIFGIIGIIQANKANTLYSQGYEGEADAANSSARTMTIIGLIFAGLGILALIFFGNFFSALGNLSYY